MRKLKQSEISDYRLSQLFNQQGCCALCKQLVLDDAVLDHDHKTGKIRAVLHRGCNAMLGKIENNMPRNKLSLDRLEEFSKNLVRYLKASYPDVIHPTHKTAEEKKVATAKRAKQRRQQLKEQNANS